MATCGEVLAHLLDAYGIDTAFGIPGTHTIELYRGLPQTGIRHLTGRHEQGLGFMADGFARVTGRPAVCITVSGPGALNIATAMSQAKQDSVPMLVISADNKTWQRGKGEGRLHETRNLHAVMAECSVWNHTLMRAADLPWVLAHAFAIFAAERPGPVHIAIPVDVITEPADDVATDAWALPGRPAANPAILREAAALLDTARYPVIALGGGAVDAADAVVALAEALDTPVTTTHNAKGILPRDHPLHVGGSPSAQPIRALYREADVVLGIGTEFGETDYDFFLDGGFGLGGKLIRVDIDPAQLLRNAHSSIAIRADARLAVEGLLTFISSTTQREETGQVRTARVREALRMLDHSGYQQFLDVIQDTLPGAVLIGDSTQPAYFAAAQYSAPAPRRFASAATGYGTLGFALPCAFGAKLGLPEVPVVALVGDGGMQFTLNELASGVEAELAVAVIVWNNECYDMIAQEFREVGMDPIGCDIYTPDFVKIAEAYGCAAARATNIAELKRQLQDAQSRNFPTVIEVMERDFI